MDKERKNRETWIDIARILLSFGVITIHGKIQYNYPSLSSSWIQYVFVGSIATCCVPVFLMLSGYLVLENKCYVDKKLFRRVARVLLMVLEQFFICVIISIVLNFYQERSMEGIIKGINTWEAVVYGRYYYWVLMGCYISSPFFSMIIEDEKMEIYFLITGVIFGLIIPCFVDLNYVDSPIGKLMMNFDKAEVMVPVGAGYLFVLGHWLGKISRYISKRIGVLLFVIIFIMWETAQIVSNLTGNINITKVLGYGRYYGSYVSPMIIVYSASVFLFFISAFKNICFSVDLSKMISNIAKRCTYIFMIHGAVISVFRPIIPHFFADTPLISVLLDSTIYFLVSYVGAIVLEETFGRVGYIAASIMGKRLNILQQN